MNANELSVWWQGLSWGRPLLAATIASVVVTTWTGARHQVSLLERGRSPRPMPRLEPVHAALLCAGFCFLRDNNAMAGSILSWPNRNVPYYSANSSALWLGSLAGGYAGIMIGKRIAPLILRRRAAKMARMGYAPMDGMMPEFYPSSNAGWEDIG